ncbi:XkdX family protein [Clostridium sp. VAP41]|uniref:XkdX family protein n=1 Tax=Clostridium sp. VAP41 TaxID=2949979 RepID=UPI00207958C1|nr:XkdX family protein [Clostridium sp. VAP41]
MNFWKMAFEYEWITAEELKGVVKTESNKFGEITVEQYKEITNVDYTEERRVISK